jgi:hypothetical protein
MVFEIKGGTETEVFENRVLRRIFGLKKADVVGNTPHRGSA